MGSPFFSGSANVGIAAVHISSSVVVDTMGSSESMVGTNHEECTKSSTWVEKLTYGTVWKWTCVGNLITIVTSYNKWSLMLFSLRYR